MDLLDTPWTVERFLAWEDRQEGRHEFDGERVIAMTGGSVAHQRLVFQLMMTLTARLDRVRFDMVQEMRLRFDRRVRYPDVCVVRGNLGQTVRTLDDAIVLFEVLSDDTAAIDQRDKRLEYLTIPGLVRYVMIAQDRVGAISLRRDGTDWVEEPPDAMGVALPELGIHVPFAELYARLTF